MNALRIYVPVLLSLSVLPLGAQQPAEGWSPSGKLKFEIRGGKEADKHIWILPEGKSEVAKKMATTMGWGNLRVHISPDDKIIVIQDGGGSIGINLRVFRATEGTRPFVEDEAVRLGDMLEKWALKKAKAAEGSFLGHRYLRLHGWSPDGKKALISISGHEGKLQIPGWFAIYDFESGELSFDLEGMNG